MRSLLMLGGIYTNMSTQLLSKRTILLGELQINCMPPSISNDRVTTYTPCPPNSLRKKVLLLGIISLYPFLTIFFSLFERSDKIHYVPLSLARRLLGRVVLNMAFGSCLLIFSILMPWSCSFIPLGATRVLSSLGDYRSYFS